jgi:chaperonin GroEL
MFNEQNASAITHVIFKSEARKALFEGLEIAAEAVSLTLGPRGKTVLIQKNGEAPTVTKDGVTVSKSIKLKDPIKRMGAELIREAASQTNEIAGDGTTTATVLTYAMVKEGLKLLEAGYSSKDLCAGIKRALARVDAELVSAAKQLVSSAEIAQIGTISANGDTVIGDLIAQAMDKVGKDGIITVEDAKGMSTTLEVVEGMQFDRGYVSPYFVTNTDKMNVLYQDVRVLVTDKKLSSMREIIPVLEKVVKLGAPLLIIAEDVDTEALHGLVLNRLKGNLPVVAIKAPGYGKHRDELLNDICVLTGGKLVSSATGLKIEDIQLNDLGILKKIVVDAKASTLVGSGATADAVTQHTVNLRSQLEDVTLSAEEIVKLKMRIAKLASGVAVIKVGGATEVEMVERKYRIEDALNATRAAAEEGIVPGGGMALVNAAESLKMSFDAGLASRDEVLGASIVMKACFAPLRRIVENAGRSPDVVLNDLAKNSDLTDIKHRGYDAAGDVQVDMFASGIIDPVKVTRTAMKNAASVAMTFLSLDAVIVEESDAERSKD